MRAAGYGAIAVVTGAALLALAALADLEGLRIAAAVVLVGGAIYLGIIAAFSPTVAVVFQRVKPLLPRTVICIVAAMLLVPALIALVVSLVGTAKTPLGVVASLTLLAIITCAAVTAYAALRRGTAPREGTQ